MHHSQVDVCVCVHIDDVQLLVVGELVDQAMAEAADAALALGNVFEIECGPPLLLMRECVTMTKEKKRPSNL